MAADAEIIIMNICIAEEVQSAHRFLWENVLNLFEWRQNLDKSHKSTTEQIYNSICMSDR